MTALGLIAAFLVGLVAGRCLPHASGAAAYRAGVADANACHDRGVE